MAKKLNIQTNKTVRPFIYCYTTPNDVSHTGWCKIGYTEDDVQARIKSQTHTSDTEVKLEWSAVALFDNGESFTDKQFHVYLNKVGIEQKSGHEWFKIDPVKAKTLLNTFKEMRLPDEEVVEYVLREEQKTAVELAKAYMPSAEKKELLLNAKPRFGKTLTVYDYCKEIDAHNILILTNRPVIATSWYNDYVKFIGVDSEYSFVSHCDSVKNQPYCSSRAQYLKGVLEKKKTRCIEFVSLQDLKGSKWFGGHFDKLREVADIEWDILIVDESHEGIDTFKTNIAFKQIKRTETIYLSGTPFKQLANSRFSNDAIFNWTYAEEQEKKANWNYEEDGVNPYEDLPQLNLYTYRLPDMFSDENRLESEADRSYLYDLNEFFKTNDKGKFINDKDVNHFLDTITSVEKYPLSDESTKSQISHSLWLLDRVDAAKALAKKMQTHPEFVDYKIIVAAGDGKIDSDEKADKAFNKVVDAIKKHNKTITISVGQLTTGVTVPEWSAVFMLSNIASPSLYIQAAFRAQNPCLISQGNGSFVRKENAYVFDFDPARTLDIMAQFANGLYADTAAGKGTAQDRAINIEKLIKYFPIIGENDDGELVSYTPEDVMTIPSKIHSREIVRHGFMSNFLFQNVGRIFNDPKALDILGNVKEHKGNSRTVPSIDNLHYDENGQTVVADDTIQSVVDKIQSNVDAALPKEEHATQLVDMGQQLNPSQSFLESLRGMQSPPSKDVQEKRDAAVGSFANERAELVKNAISTAIGNQYQGNAIFNTKKIEKDIIDRYKARVAEAKIQHDIDVERLRVEHAEKMKQQLTAEDAKQCVADYKAAQEKQTFEFECQLIVIENTFKKDVVKETITDIETRTQEKVNKKAEDDFAFPKLRAFSRSIPAFLMAYGTRETTCDKFGDIIPKDIFKEMTGIELDDYMYFIDQQYFNEITFNDAIKEFFNVREQLSNYFIDSQDEDIFDYIPPQKTNQIFTPKKVVAMMVDMLEENNPGCFDDPDKTFIDLYMKSGLYITEIVKRLYRSEKMKELFPDETERLKHIFKYQVYGLAPTEIIFNIAKNFILGFDASGNIQEHNLVQFDAQPYAENGTLEKKLDELFKASSMDVKGNELE